jgi:hypothetical protein
MRIEVNADRVTKHHIPVRVVSVMSVEFYISDRNCNINLTHCRASQGFMLSMLQLSGVL